MKIYLLCDGEWKLFNNPTAEELSKRGIFISNNAKIYDYVRIGNLSTIKDNAIIYEHSTIGKNVLIEKEVKIGMSSDIGNHAVIKYGANISDGVKIGKRVIIDFFSCILSFSKIGDFTVIGKFSIIGSDTIIGDNNIICEHSNIASFSKIKQIDTISPAQIMLNFGIDVSSGIARFYAAVKPDLTSFFNDSYQYKIGKGDEIKGILPNPKLKFGEGFYFTSFLKSIAMANNNPHKIISAEINIDDILSVSDNIRVRKFSDVQIANIKGIE